MLILRVLQSEYNTDKLPGNNTSAKGIRGHCCLYVRRRCCKWMTYWCSILALSNINLGWVAREISKYSYGVLGTLKCLCIRIVHVDYNYVIMGAMASQITSLAIVYSAVREITKCSSTFSATNISSNIIQLLQLHDTIRMKSNYTWINYNHDDIAIRSHIMIYNFVWNLFLVPNLVAFISQKEKNVGFFCHHLLTCIVRKMVLICLMQNIDMCLLYKSHQVARLVSHLINHFSKWMFTVKQ